MTRIKVEGTGTQDLIRGIRIKFLFKGPGFRGTRKGVRGERRGKKVQGSREGKGTSRALSWILGSGIILNRGILNQSSKC